MSQHGHGSASASGASSFVAGASATITAIAASASSSMTGSTTSTTATKGSGRSGHGGKKIVPDKASLIYQYLFLALLFLLFVRNVILLTHKIRSRRRAARQAAASFSSPLTGSARATVSKTYAANPLLVRWVKAVDRFALREVHLPYFGRASYFRLLVVFLTITFNVIASCVLKNGSTLTKSRWIKSWANKTGLIATANYPLLFAFFGRANLVTLVTGSDSNTVRFYHKFVGIIAFVLSLHHTIVYVAWYAVYSPTRLKSENARLYWKMGIVAVCGMFVCCIFSLIRRGFYELFLVTHMVGAILMLLGSYKHRPEMIAWVWAACGFWIFERFIRVIGQCFNIYGTRFALRLPVITAEAELVHGALLLSVPVGAARWEAGQYFNIAFWGREFITRPWMYGQTHPFTVQSVPNPADNGQSNAVRFIIRVHDGMTLALAHHVEKISKASGSPLVKVSLTLEGPYGHAAPVETFDSVLAIAGGSGITHVVSNLVAALHVNKERGATSRMRLVWALQHLDQAEWSRRELEEARTLATECNVDLQLDFFVTRDAGLPYQSSTSVTSSSNGSITYSNASTPVDEIKKMEFDSSSASPFAGAVVHAGRPDIAAIIKAEIAQSVGRTFISACGPDSLTNSVAAVRVDTKVTEVEIASFEM